MKYKVKITHTGEKEDYFARKVTNVMRIYQINVVCGNGSTGRIVVELSRFVQEQGGSCRIAYGRGQCSNKEIDCIKISSKADNYVHALLTRMTDRHGLYSKKATENLICDIEKYAPDLIHLHNLHGYYLNYEKLFLFLKAYGRPVLWTMHDCWAFTGHCAHYDSVKCSKWKEDCYQCPILHNYPATLCGKNVAENYARKKECFTSIPKLTIVTPSRWLKNQLSQSFLKEQKCIVIPNGINLTQFAPTDSNLRQSMQCEDKILLLGVANVWTKSKGLEDFLQLRTMLDSRYVMCMVGLTEKQIRMLPEGIFGRAKTESIRELAQYYSAADFFLSLTYEDTFAMVNIESIACGTPVIAYRTGGSTEAISEKCGKIVQTGDLMSIKTFLQNEIKEKNYYQDACINRALLYEGKKIYKEYMKIYKRIIEETA